MALTGELKPTAIDLFSGAGGATQGLVEAGFRVVAAVENDRSAAASYKLNHPKVLVDMRDIRHVDPRTMRKSLHIRKGTLGLLKACPPCQGHSSLNRSKGDDPRNQLIAYIWPFVREFEPRIVLLENVPRLRDDERLATLVKKLKAAGYKIGTMIADARSFGVPQRRKRFIMMAVRGKSRAAMPETLESLIDTQVGRYAISLSSVFRYDKTRRAKADPLHISPRNSKHVSDRIAAIPRNGNRFDLPAYLTLPCHANLRNGATSSYGRISLRLGYASTMTTRCTSPSCGAFLHPTKNRAITLREASLIQTFPRTYRFEGSYSEIERQIGNAVPVRMARGLGLVARAFLP